MNIMLHEAYKQQKRPVDLFRELGRSDEMLCQKADNPLGKAGLDAVALAEADRIRGG